MTDATEGEGESTWGRLRRRKLVQWGIAYAAGAWGFLQGLAYVSELLEWPAQLQKLTGLALLIGLPIALVLAWYHGDKGERRVTRTELTVLTLLFLVGGGIFWRYQQTVPASEFPAVAQATAPAATPATPIPTDRSIAVLPFVNMSSDKEQEYFSDGISEELLNLLVQVPELRVIARTSSFSFKDKEVGIAEIAEKLNVAHVLEGSVRKSGDTLRITAQLIRTADSSQLWSQTYDRQMTDVFAVQDEIAAAVVEQLKIKLLNGAPMLRVTDPQAYALFLQAREISRQGTASALEQSISLYRQALAIDPAYVMALVGLAEAYSSQVDIYARPASDAIRLARDAIEKALVIDPKFALALARLGIIASWYERDLAAGATHIEHALALQPANPDILVLAAGLSRRLGRLDQAIAISEFLLIRDPVNVIGGSELAISYYYAGRLDEAIATYRNDIRLFPTVTGDHEMIGEVLLLKGDAKAALEEFKLEPSEAHRLTGLSMAYHALGQRTESDAALVELIEKYEKTMAWNIALVLAFRNEADQAFAWLNKAVEYQDPTVGSTATYPLLANLHSDPRWLPFLRRVGVAPEQLAAIKFDVTVPK